MNKETKKLLLELEEAEKLNEGQSQAEFDINELEELRRDKALRVNLEKELNILKEIFPDIDADTIPDTVFEESDNGKGLAALYALFYLKDMKQKEQTAKKNEENSAAALPEITSEEEAYFTPEMVKAMSQKEIRKNYKAIMKSMEKWSK